MSKIKDKEFLNKLREKQLEVAAVPTQNLGSLTPYYKSITPYLKYAPWKVIAVVAFLTVVILRLLFGNSFVNLASILQRGI